jgi:MFS family permease
MIPNGIQMVMLSYLMAIELKQPADSFGITQMVGQLPLLLILLMGGWVADRVDIRRWLMTLQGIGMIMPLVLAFLLWRGAASEASILLYAVVWGIVGAFSLPARDGLLRRVAGTNVQKMVGLAIGMQYAAQMVGQAIAGQAARVGTVTVLLLLGIPFAGWSAYASLRGLVPSKPIRIWAGATYALLPAMTGAVASGRIGLTIAAIALPVSHR